MEYILLGEKMTEDYQLGFTEGHIAGSIEERQKIIRALLDNPNLVSECIHVADNGATIFIPGRFISKLDGTPDPTLPDQPI